MFVIRVCIEGLSRALQKLKLLVFGRKCPDVKITRIFNIKNQKN